MKNDSTADSMVETEFKKEMGKRIQEVRKAANLTQEQLAEKIEVGTSFISGLERGKKGLKLETFCKICTACSASSDYILFGVKDDMKVPFIIQHACATLPDEQLRKLVTFVSGYMDALQTDPNTLQ